MSKVKPIIKKGSEHHIYLGILNPSGPFPNKIYAHSMCINDDPVIYIPRIFAHTILVTEDDDNVIGHCFCSQCKKSVNMFDAYCRHCGAKLKSRKILGEDYEKDSFVYI